MKANKYVLVVLGVIVLFFILSKIPMGEDAQFVINDQVVEEADLEVETWMSNDLVWSLNLEDNQIFNVTIDDNFEIESWMTNDEIWQF